MSLWFPETEEVLVSINTALHWPLQYLARSGVGSSSIWSSFVCSKGFRLSELCMYRYVLVCIS